MSYTKLSRRRFATLLAVLALLGASVLAQLVGRHRVQERVRLAARVAEDAARALVLTERLRGRLLLAMAPAAARQEAEDSAVNAELVEEHGEAVDAVLADLAALRREGLLRQVKHEALEGKVHTARLLDAAAAGRRNDLLAAARRLRDHLDSLEDALEESTASATAVLLNEHAAALRWLRLGMWAAVAAAAAGLLLALSMASDMLQEAMGPVNLAAELAELAQSEQFQARMGLLGSQAGTDGQAAPWSLRLERVTSDRRTHLVFLAVASRAGRDVPLWGKRYKWTGHLKSLQRLLWPAYGTATWEILSTMHSRGMGGPVPIACQVLRARRLPVGRILLAERVGPTENLRGFLARDYPLLPPERRMALAAALGSFIRRLHDVGIYDLSPRYYYGAGLDGPPERVRFYLFDLDKARIAFSPPAWLARLRRARDDRRILRLLRRHATHEEMAALRRHLSEPAVPATPAASKAASPPPTAPSASTGGGPADGEEASS